MFSFEPQESAAGDAARDLGVRSRPKAAGLSVRAVLAALGVWLPACSASAPPPAEPPPVLIVGLDGFEWNVIEPSIAAGRMPNLARLMERGVCGTLDTLEPTNSPRLWTTLATGKLPEKHGILGFTKEGIPEAGKRRKKRKSTPDSGGRHLFTRMDRRVKAYWNILAERGISTDTIGWWMTYPPEEVPGLMVSQVNTLRRERGLWKGGLKVDAPDQVWPPEEEPWVLALLEEHDRNLDALTAEIFGTFSPALEGERADRWDECLWAFRADSTYVTVLERRVAGGVPSRVTAIYLGGTDVVGHRFWSAYDPEPFGLAPDDPEVRVFGHVIPSYYAYVDSALGRLLELYPEDTTVFLVSDHGMAPLVRRSGAPTLGRTGTHVNDPGAFVAAGYGIARPASAVTGAHADHRRSLGSVVDFCPTLLTLLGLPYGEDMDGRPMRAVLDGRLFDAARSVPTHDDQTWLATQDPSFVDDERERVEQLRNLGYLGDEADEE